MHFQKFPSYYTLLFPTFTTQVPISSKTMFPFTKITYFLILLITPTFSQQSYDRTNCTALEQVPGSNYLCNSQKTDCDTFIVYRAQENYNTLSSIASLFNTTIPTLLSFNDISTNNLNLGKEILVPVMCTCSDRFSYVDLFFDASKTNSSYDVACGAFEGLVKEQILLDQNRGLSWNVSKTKSIQIAIRCACPDGTDIGNGTKFLVTYPVMENEYPNLISSKFGVPVDLIFNANKLNTFDAIYPHTTLLIPTNKVPVLNSLSQAIPAPSPRFVAYDISPGHNLHHHLTFYIGWGFLAMLLLMVLWFSYFIFMRKKNNPSKFKPLSEAISLKFSPQLRDGMSKLKHSLVIFSPEELSIATGYFSKANVIGTAVYKAKINTTYLAIEQMSTEQGARHVIDILTKINHLNVVKLVGCCYGPTPFLAYEYAEYGSLRDCLSNTKLAKQLHWKARVQIAFDLAIGLHYIHHCTKPSYVHRNINSRNVLIGLDLRAKISGFRLAKTLKWTEEKEGLTWKESEIVGKKGYLAPEYLTEGQASMKIDVYAFGVVLLELLSANVVIDDGKIFKHSISFLDGEALTDSNGCLEKFSSFMDPALEGNYPVGDAMCLAFLSMGCLEEEPIHRPSMNDVLKAMSRFI